MKIIKVSEDRNSYYLTTDDSTGFRLLKKYKVVPKVGDDIEVQTVHFSTVRGIILNGKQIFYKTDEDLEKEHQNWLDKNEKKKQRLFIRNKPKLDKDYNTLPEEFKKRIDKFRMTNPRFRVDYEPYEMFCCKEALKIAKALKGKTEEEVQNFSKADYTIQKQTVPKLGKGHSGNTFGVAVRLAYWYLFNPENVILEHGALTTLVGCDAYGCPHEKKEG